MLILGIDPGTAITGYGVVEQIGNRLVPVDYGAIRTPASTPAASRLRTIHEELTILLEKHSPEVVAVEQLFFNRNVTTALAVGQARGVIILTAAQRNLEVSEYTPLQVKQAVTGQGRARKEQVGYMVRVLLGLSEVPSPDDVADALAVAICHAHTAPVRTSWRAQI